MEFKAFLRNTLTELQKLRPSKVALYNKSTSATEDSVLAPSPRLIRSPTSQPSPILSTLHQKKRKLRKSLDRLLGKTSTSADIKKEETSPTKGVVGPAQTSRLPHTLGRRNPAPTAVFDASEAPSVPKVSEISVAQSPEPSASLEILTTQASQLKSGESGSHIEDSIVSEDEQALHMRSNLQLVPVSFFQPKHTRPSSHELQHIVRGSPLQRVSLSENLCKPTIPAILNLSVPLSQKPSTTQHLDAVDPLNSRTGALVFYQPKARSRRSLRLLHVTEDTPDGPEGTGFDQTRQENDPDAIYIHGRRVVGAFHDFGPGFEEESGWYLEIAGNVSNQGEFLPPPYIQGHVFEIGDVETAVPPSRLSAQHLGTHNDSGLQRHVESVPTKRCFLVSSQDTVVAASPQQETSGYAQLKAKYEAEIAQLKRANAENLEMLASDIQEEQEKTERFKTRAARNARELRASLHEQKSASASLTAAQEQIAALTAELLKEKEDKKKILDAGSQLHDWLDTANANYAAVLQDRDRIWTECYNVRQNHAEQTRIMDQMRNAHVALTHQAQLAVSEKGAAIAGQMHLQEQLDRLRVVNRALLSERADDYEKLPLGAIFPGQIRPDQVKDAEQALLVSQEGHKKANERASELMAELDRTQNLLETESGIHSDLKVHHQHLSDILQRATSLENANCTMTRFVSDPEADSYDPELTNAIITAKHDKVAFLKTAHDARMNEHKLRELLRQKDSQLDLVATQHREEISELTAEKEAALEDNLGMAIEIRDLKKVVVLYRGARKDCNNMQDEVTEWRNQVATRAISREDRILWNDLNGQMSELQTENTHLDKLVYDQQLVIDKLRAEQGMIFDAKEKKYSFPRSIMLARDRYHATVEAFKDRFGHLLSDEDPLLVDVTGYLALLTEEEVNEFLQFPEHLIQSGEIDLGDQIVSLPDRMWMRVVIDQARLDGTNHISGTPPEDIERMLGAVEAETLKRRRQELDEARALQEADEQLAETYDEMRKQHKEETAAAYNADREQLRQDAAAIKEEVATVLKKVRQRADWDSIDPNQADTAEEAALETGSNYGEDYGQPWEPEQAREPREDEESAAPSATLVNSQQPNSSQVPTESNEEGDDFEWPSEVF